MQFSSLLNWPTKVFQRGSQWANAATAAQHLLKMQLPPLSPNPPPTGCEVVGACYMIWSMLSRGEQGECLGERTQSQRDEKTKVSWCWVSYPCNGPDCQHLTWIKHPVCLSGSSLDRFFIWGQWRTTCPLCQCFYAPAACWCAYAEEAWSSGGLL